MSTIYLLYIYYISTIYLLYIYYIFIFLLHLFVAFYYVYFVLTSWLTMHLLVLVEGAAAGAGADASGAFLHFY